MSQPVPHEIKHVLDTAVPQIRAATDRRRAGNPTSSPRRRRRTDAFAAVQYPPLSWG